MQLSRAGITLVLILVGCQTIESSEPEFQTGTVPDGEAQDDPIVQEDDAESVTLAAPEPLCTYTEKTECSLAGSYWENINDPDCQSTDACIRASCYTKLRVGNSLDCLRSICPSQYSDRYVGCLKDMAADEVECLLQQDSCDGDPVNLNPHCHLSLGDRHKFLQECLQ